MVASSTTRRCAALFLVAVGQDDAVAAAASSAISGAARLFGDRDSSEVCCAGLGFGADQIAGETSRLVMVWTRPRARPPFIAAGPPAAFAKPDSEGKELRSGDRSIDRSESAVVCLAGSDQAGSDLFCFLFFLLRKNRSVGAKALQAAGDGAKQSHVPVGLHC